MNTKFRILFALLGIFNISPMIFANMDSDSNMPSKSRKSLYREITPNAGPRVAYGLDVFLTGDFIWWKAYQNGLEYGSTGIVINSPTTAFQPLNEGESANVQYSWDPGFKVGIGLNFWHDGWDVYAKYTWLHTNGSNNLSAVNNVWGFQQLTYSEITPIQIPSMSAAQSRASLHFNVIDLELGRNFYLSQFLMLRPHIGFKGTWQNEDWRTRYFPSDLAPLNTGIAPLGISISLANPNAPATPLSGPYRVHHQSQYYGVGIRTGFDSAWHFTTNWSIFGNVAWAAIWSHYHLKRNDTIDDINTGEKQRLVNTQSNFYEVKYIGELQIGLRFDKWFSDDRYHLQVQAGWEEQVWINHMTYLNLINASSYFDLTMQGLTAKLRFDF